MFLMRLVRSIRPVPLKFLYFDTLVIFCEEYYYLSEYCVSCDDVLLLLSHVSFSGSTENWGFESRKGKQWYKAPTNRWNSTLRLFYTSTKSPSCVNLAVTLRSKLTLMLNTPTVQHYEQLFPSNDVTVTKPRFPF